MFDDSNISVSLHTSFFLNTAKGILFYIFFVVYGILRLSRAALVFCSNVLCRIGFSALFYLSILAIASLAVVILLSYYLIAVFGSQIRLP